MRTELAQILVCPECSCELGLHVFEAEDDAVRDGILKCTGCSGFYPIVDFIPRMLPSSLYYNEDFVRKYGWKLGQANAALKNSAAQRGSLRALKKETIAKFGFEWSEYGRFGWDDATFNIEREERVFREKSLLDLEDLQDKLVLDAGCGNGRYSYWAAQHGAKVVGVDLGYGVESAYVNTRGNSNIHIVQADILNLPFGQQLFDAIFSIGVLMHTGDARLALTSLAKHLKPGGVMSFHVYHKGNPIYELNDRILRKMTTRLSVGQLSTLTKLLHVVARTLDRVNMLKYVNLFVRLENHPHCIFDWYSAPIATHHTYPEAFGWCSGLGLEVVRDCSADRRTYLRRKIAPGASLTVCARKRGASRDAGG